MVAGLWFKKPWKGSYFLIIVACLLPSAYAFFDSSLNGAIWTIQDRAMWIFIFGKLATGLSVFLARYNDAEYEERERLSSRPWPGRSHPHQLSPSARWALTTSSFRSTPKPGFSVIRRWPFSM